VGVRVLESESDDQPALGGGIGLCKSRSSSGGIGSFAKTYCTTLKSAACMFPRGTEGRGHLRGNSRGTMVELKTRGWGQIVQGLRKRPLIGPRAMK